MNKPEVRHFAEPEEIREFPKGRVELTRIGDTIVGRWQLSRDAFHWVDDLEITYRRGK